MKKVCQSIVCVFCVGLLMLTFQLDAKVRARKEVKIPDIPGYITLKCDFHMHSVFSDGSVWPTVRTEEAWLEGLDAFSLTDHIEYQPHEDYVKKDHNRSYLLARGGAGSLNLLLIRAGEITRSMPPGHFNAIFLKDVDPLDKEDFWAAMKAAADQGAFIFWNHPGWQQKDEIPIWYEEHEKVFQNGWMHGMEIVNGPSYYPLAHQWCLDKKITMIGCSDIHGPTAMTYDTERGEHREMTLVFAKERTAEAIREALFSRRTAVYQRDRLIGESQYLAPIFSNSIEVINPEQTIRGTRQVYLQINNRSDVPFRLELEEGSDLAAGQRRVTLHADRTVTLSLRGKSETQSGTHDVTLNYRVNNLLIAPNQGLPVQLKVKITFIPESKK